MSQLLSYFVRLCLFRSGPQDAPVSERLLLVIAAVLTISYTLTNTIQTGLVDRVIIAVTEVVVFGAVIWLVLRIKNLESRWLQTLIALYGVAALFQLVSWPVIASNPVDDSAGIALPQPLWFHLGVGLWYLAVMSHVLRHALDTTLGRGVAAAVFCQLGTLVGLYVVLAFLGVGDTQT